jgi:MHS family proline/betaine transporter-like MFS transporter
MLLAVLSYRPIYQSMYAAATLPPQLHNKFLEGKISSNELKVNEIGDSIFVKTDWVKYQGTTHKIVESRTKFANPTLQLKTETNRTVWLSAGGFWFVTILVFVQILFVTMVYGPIAAFLVELFPTRIRYTSMSLPYHIGNGIFGGLTPYIATRLVTESKQFTLDGSTDPFFGLWYPIAVAGVCFVIGLLFLPLKNDENLND